MAKQTNRTVKRVAAEHVLQSLEGRGLFVMSLRLVLLCSFEGQYIADLSPHGNHCIFQRPRFIVVHYELTE